MLVPLFAPLNTAPPSLAEYVTMTGTGSFTYPGPDPYIDVEYGLSGLLGDGATTFTESGHKIRLRTEDGGLTFYSLPDINPSIALASWNGLYQDLACSETASGHQISTAY
jgi:hypothetical protein